MIKKQEIWNLLLAVVILTILISFSDFSLFSIAFLFAVIIIFSNLLAKKLAAYFYETDITTRIWHFQRFGFSESMHFKKPIPMGFILPLVLAFLSVGFVKWLAITEFDAEPTSGRSSKRHGFWSFSELTEFHLGIIAAAGIVANLIIAVLAYIFNLQLLARFSIYYACFNMLPLGQLDGNKIFFGSLILWLSLAIICSIFLGSVIFLI